MIRHLIRDRLRRRSRSRACPDRGGGAVEFAIIAAPLLLVSMMVLQTALVFYARSIALAAATQGANAGRQQGSTDATARANADDFLGVIGPGLQSPTVTVARNAANTEVTVVVTGRAVSLIPFLNPFEISQQAHGPVERWVP
ncbi:TadE/TadG family type IV pilus assembly protein [Catellatospora chokoriensis]|uniref:Membrane protein n=1 Tax=Catellatospora chokoriensis TaxID=310353 RepID=A0A8J3JN05_9ACTN|nr:TadE/TadG family type IV pilus assembly protein [Catellatospora chokoriensis]GIF87857.1 membrane protein [Catellatospora chokoriensis]